MTTFTEGYTTDTLRGIYTYFGIAIGPMIEKNKETVSSLAYGLIFLFQYGVLFRISVIKDWILPTYLP